MNITKNQIDELNAVISVKIEKTDYEEKVEKALKETRRKVAINGFRPGKVPMNLVKKVYGKAVIYDEVNKMLQDSLYKYLQDEKLRTLGDPLPVKDQKPVDFDTEINFEFNFEIGLAPEINLELNEKIELPSYSITVTDETIEKRIEEYQKQYGPYDDVEKLTESGYLVCEYLPQLKEKGDLIYIYIAKITDEEEKQKLLGASLGDVLHFNIRKAMSEKEIGFALHLENEDLEKVPETIEITVKNLKDKKMAELDEKLFNLVFSGNEIKTIEEFKEKIKEEHSIVYSNECRFRFNIDAKKTLIEMVKIELPETFLKRWLTVTDTEKKLTPEIIESDFPRFTKDLKWQLIKEKILSDFNIQVDNDEIQKASSELVKFEFAYYGIPYSMLKDELIEGQVTERMKNQEFRKRAIENAYENKIFEVIKEKISLKQLEITLDELNELYKKEEVKE